MCVIPSSIITFFMLSFPLNGDSDSSGPKSTKSMISPLPLMVTVPWSSRVHVTFSPHVPDFTTVCACAPSDSHCSTAPCGSTDALPKSILTASAAAKIRFFIFCTSISFLATCAADLYHNIYYITYFTVVKLARVIAQNNPKRSQDFSK